MTQIKGYVRMEQQEEFEAWEREQIKLREKESNDAIAELKAKNGGRIPHPSYEEQDFSFRNTNAYDNY